MPSKGNYYRAGGSADGAFVVAILCMQNTRDSLLIASQSELRIFCTHSNRFPFDKIFYDRFPFEMPSQHPF